MTARKVTGPELGSDQRAAPASQAGNGNKPVRFVITGILRFDRQLRVLSVTPGLETLTGIAPQRLLEKELEQSGIPSELSFWLRNLVWRTFEAGEELEAEFSFLDPSGKAIRLNGIATPELGADGQHATVVCVLRDVTTGPGSPELPETFASWERIQLMINSVPDLMSYVDRDRRYVIANQAYTERFGIAAAEMRGKHMEEVIGFEAMEALRPYISRALSGETVSFEDSVKYEDGKTRVIEGHYVPDFVNGEVAGIVVRISDITEQKRAQHAALHLAAIVADSDDAIISKDLNGIITSWNAAAERLFGHLASEAIGQPIAMLAVPEKADEMPAVLERIREGQTVHHFETVRQGKDGKPLNVSLTVSPIRDPSGHIIGASKIVRDISEQRRFQLALQAREEESRNLLASLPDIICRFSRDRRFQYVSPAIESKTGLPVEFFVQKTHAEAGLPKPISDLLEAKLDEIFTTGLPATVEFEMAAPDGSIRNYQGTGVPEFAPDKSVRTILAIVRDVTEQKRAEQAQVALERELLLLIEAAGTLLASPETGDVSSKIVDLARRFVSADAYAVWRREDSADYWHISSSSGLSTEYVNHSLIAAPQGSLDFTEPAMVADIGSLRWLSPRLEDLKNEGVRSMLIIPLQIFGHFSGTVVFYWRTPHNFTHVEVRISTALGNLAASALRTAELYERQLQLRALAEASQRDSAFLAEVGAALSSSLKYEQTLANLAKLAVPGFADWCSVSILDENKEVKRLSVEHTRPDKVQLARELSLKYPPSESDVAQVALRTGSSMLVKEVTDEMIEARARDPEHARLIRQLGLRSVMIVPMKVGDRVLGVITFGASESDRRYDENDLRTAEEVARRAGAAIENARLYEESRRRGQALLRSNAELRRVNADLEQFAYSASHDLKEPLRMVSLFTQLLGKKYAGKLDAQALEYINHAVHGAQRMELLMRDLLAYTTASSADEQPLETIDANQVLAQTLDTLQPDLRASGAKVSHSELPSIRMHGAQLQQLFQNLIGNALKYRSAEPPEIRISAEPNDEYWTFSVSDNGIGISSQYFDQIFGLFKRLHGKDEYEGTGLGLAICKKIVETLGGRIWVESAPGKGSTFRFTLPRAD